MKTYMVGGAVRDRIMWNKPYIPFLPKDKDWVVIGSSVDEMKDLGFKIVGNQFPVFLHPVTGEEYALARKERKVGEGYNGFTFDVSSSVTLEDDLGRRDLTINAIAYNFETDDFVDPYKGIQDIKDRVLRHVNAEAFVEDPVRVLRLARFAATFTDFAVSSDTQILCSEMVGDGMLDHLTPERIVKELFKALEASRPSRFFVFLEMIGALKIIFPEIHALIGKTQPYRYHPEGDAFVHTMLLLDNADKVIDSVAEKNIYFDAKAEFMFYALTHDFGKGVSPIDNLPHHYGHEMKGVKVIDSMSKRLPLPSEFVSKAKLISQYHTHIHNFTKLKASTIVSMFDDLKVNKNHNIEYFLPMISNLDAISRSAYFVDVRYPNKKLAIDVLSDLSYVKLSNYKTPEQIKEMSVGSIKNFLLHEKSNIVKTNFKK